MKNETDFSRIYSVPTMSIRDSKYAELQKNSDQIEISNLRNEICMMKNLVEKSQEREKFLLRILAEEKIVKQSGDKMENYGEDLKAQLAILNEKANFAAREKYSEKQLFHRICIYSTLTVSILLSCIVLLLFMYFFLL